MSNKARGEFWIYSSVTFIFHGKYWWSTILRLTHIHPVEASLLSVCPIATHPLVPESWCSFPPCRIKCKNKTYQNWTTSKSRDKSQFNNLFTKCLFILQVTNMFPQSLIFKKIQIPTYTSSVSSLSFSFVAVSAGDVFLKECLGLIGGLRELLGCN